MNGQTALDWIKMGRLDSIIATEPMQCFIDEIMAGIYLPHKFKLSSNPFRKRNWRLILSYMSFGTLAPVLLEERLLNSCVVFFLLQLRPRLAIFSTLNWKLVHPTMKPKA